MGAHHVRRAGARAVSTPPRSWRVPLRPSCRAGVPAARPPAGSAADGPSAAERRAGPQFVARGRAARVLLVDDVATTGATLAAAAVALRDAARECRRGHRCAHTPARCPLTTSLRILRRARGGEGQMRGDMDIVVRGKNRTAPPRLRRSPRRRSAKIARFTHDAGRVEVDFSEVHTARIDERQLCEITVHLKRRFLKAHAAAAEPEAALDRAHRQGGSPGRAHQGEAGGTVRTHATATVTRATVRSPTSRRRRRGVDGDEPAPRIVKTKRFAAKPMDPEEAALQMELLGHAFFLFTNTETGHAALLYRRNDGNLGLIDTVA